MLEIQTVCPVVLRVPSSEQGLTGKEKVIFLSAFARKALFMSASKSNVVLEKMNKNADGGPLPYNGVYWSISHKSTYVAGVVASRPIGIDLERIRPVDLALYDKIAGPDEWRLGGEKGDHHLFFRYWTAKETVLKATGLGLKALSTCHIDHVVDDKELVVRHGNQEWLVEQHGAEGHLVSVLKSNWQVRWHVEKHVDS
jgi:4'-phosphopantetheinyl transferase